MMSLLDYASHVFFIPSLLVGCFFLTELVFLGEKRNLKGTLLWGGALLVVSVHDSFGWNLSWVDGFACALGWECPVVGGRDRGLLEPRCVDSGCGSRFQ